MLILLFIQDLIPDKHINKFKFQLVRISAFFISLALMATLFCVQQSLAQSGSIDASFNPLGGPTSYVRTMLIQNDGKIIITGNFTAYNGVARYGLARVDSSGLLDNTFNPGNGTNNFTYSSVLQPDGKIIIAGNFTTYNGIPRNRIARINSSGTLDFTFNPGSAANGDISSIALQNDGKIIIGGGFTSYNGSSVIRLARLNSDGSLDSNFNAGTGPDNNINVVALQPDGKILIAGGFSFYNGILLRSVGRLNNDGTMDTSFNPGTGANGGILSLNLQVDGKIIIGGNFSQVNGSSRNGIARLNADGTLNAGFNPGTGANNVTFTCILSTALQADGKILIGGGFTTYNGVNANRISRLNSNGSIDTTFVINSGANDNVWSIVPLSNGKIMLGGAFTNFNNTARIRLARLMGDSCSAHFTMYADTIPHNWIAVNQATGTPPLTYSWNWGDGSALSTGPNPSHTYINPGYYNICLTTTDATGCTDTYCDSSTYLNRGSSDNAMVTVNVIVPTGLSEHELVKESLLVYPNPTAGVLNLVSENEKIDELQLVDSRGVLLNTWAINSLKATLDLRNYSDGVYVLCIKTASGTSHKKLQLHKQ